MKDLALEAYVEAIEGHFRARRGTEHILSPPDFALARSWHQAGVPLATVLAGLDRAFDSAEGITSLSFCRRRVEELLAAGPRPQLQAPPAGESLSIAELADVLGTLLERLQDLRPGPGMCFDLPLRRIQEVRDLLSVAARPNWDLLRRKLRDIDDDVSAVALQTLSVEQRAELRAEAERAVVRQRGRLGEATIEDACTRYLLRRARERLGLPRVDLL